MNRKGYFSIIILILIFSTFVGMIKIPSSNATSNILLDNGDFETGTLDPWTTWTSPVASVTTNSFYVHSGSYGCKLEQYISGIYERSSISQAVHYEYDTLENDAITFWMKCQGGAVTLRVYYSDETTDYWDFFDSSSTWIQKTLQKSSLDEGKDLASIKLTSKYDGYKVAVDDVKVLIVSELLNGDFETGTLNPWTTWTSPVASVTTDSYYVHSGSYGCKLEQYISGIYERSSISQAVYYEYDMLEDNAITFWMKCPTGAGVTLRVYYVDGDTDYWDYWGYSTSWVSVTLEKSELKVKDISVIKLTSKVDGYKVAVDDVKVLIVSEILNGDFETGSLDPWTTWLSVEAQVSSYYLYVHSGSYGCALAIAVNSRWERTQISQNIHIEVDDLYTKAITFYMKCPSSTISVRYYYSDGENAIITFDPSSSWIQRIIPKSTFTPGKILTNIKFTTTSDESLSAIDDIQIRLGDELDNGDFGTGSLSPWTTSDYASISTISSDYWCMLSHSFEGHYVPSTIYQEVLYYTSDLASTAMQFMLFRLYSSEGVIVTFYYSDSASNSVTLNDLSQLQQGQLITFNNEYFLPNRILIGNEFTGLFIEDVTPVYIDDIEIFIS
ncbi:MAG: carbohydrate binding domain-containing protein [Candidatus Thorarchaeota archaeon]